MSGLSRDDIDRMAREVGFPERRAFSDLSDLYPRLEQFANLVAAAERNRTWTQDHWTEYERSIAAAEREACAKILDDMAAKDRLSNYFQVAAIAIRARGKNAA